jgi:ketosteroid isomerase-like protein
MILLTSPLIMTINATNDNSIDSEYFIRKLIREYVNAMNKRSTENIIALFDEEGQFIDKTFNQEFSGIKELTNLYSSIFSMNNRLTFTAFPWKIEIEESNALVTCSWSLVSNYGVYNGVYWINTGKVSNEWKITEITALITVVHRYHPPYTLLS